MSLAMTATCQAMQQILQLHLPGNLAAENSQLRAENARLQAEVQQLRAAAASPCGNGFHTQDPRFRLLTWQEYGEERDQKTRELVDKIDEAANRLRMAIHNVLVCMDARNETRALDTAHCSLVQIRNFLEGEEEEEEEEEYDEESEEEDAEEAEEEGAEEEQP